MARLANTMCGQRVWGDAVKPPLAAALHRQELFYDWPCYVLAIVILDRYPSE